MTVRPPPLFAARSLSLHSCCAILHRMMKALEIAIEKLKALPEDRQAYAAQVIEQIAASDTALFRIPDEHLAAVFEGLEQASSGEFANDEEIDRALRRPWA